MPTSRESLITVLYGSSATTSPSDLYDGELAFANGSGSNKKLFIGSGGNNTSNWVGAIIEDQATINWSSVSSENNKLATQWAVKSLAGNYLPLSGGSLTGDLTLGTTSEIIFTARGGGGGTLILQAPTATTSNAAYTFTLPVNDGNAAEVLTTDGNGVLSWSSAGTATNVSVTDDDTTTTAYIAFTNATSGATALRVDSDGLTYNASTDTLTIAGDLAVNGGDITTTSTGTATVFNTNATTVNMAGAATTATIGYNSTAASTTNLSTGAVAASTTKTVNIATGGAADSSAVVNIGSANTSDTQIVVGSGGPNLVYSPGSLISSITNLNSISSFSRSTSYPKLTISNPQHTSATSGDPAKIELIGSDTGVGQPTTCNILPTTNVVGTVNIGGSISGNTLKINSTTGGTINHTTDVTTGTVNLYTGVTTGTINVGSGTSNTVVAGDLAVNGGDITTTSAGTATVFNTNATTVNMAGAGTTVSIGAATGTATINNANTVVTGDLAVNGGDITTSATTFNLLNTTATTLNVGGAATSVTIGSTSSGTAHIRNSSLMLGNTTNTITTNAAAGSNHLTLAPYGDVVLAPTSTAATLFSGTFPTVTVNPGVQATVDFAGGDIYLGTKSSDDLSPVVTPVNIIWEGATDNGNETTLTVADPSADRTITLPDATGTVALVAGSDTQVMFNDGGSALGGDSGLTYNKTTDSLTITGDLAVNGGDITTTDTGTATVFNTNATTLNIGGAGTTVSIGAATGTATINNANTVVTGDLAVNGGDITTSATTFNLLNATATTLNIGGAATTATIGYNSTANSTTNISTGAVTIGGVKTLNLGTGGAASSTTNVNIGSQEGGTTIINSTTLAGSALAGTQNVFNTTHTTVNAFGAATALTMGATSAATTTIRGGTLVGNTTTQNVFDTTATTVNAFGAATTASFGHDGASAATTSIANGATGSGSTNTINIGASGASGSTTNVNIGSAAGGTVALGYNATVGNNLTVTGDLTVNGDTVTVNTSTLSVEDPLIKLANGNTALDTVDIGFYGLYDTSGSLDLYCGLFRDASDGKFRLFVDSQSEPTTTVNTGATGYTVGTLVANIRGGTFT